MGWWGAKRVDETQETRLTMSAFNFPQLTQTDSRIFLTLTMKPSKKRFNESQRRERHSQRTWMKHGSCQLDVAKVPRAFSHSLSTSLTLEVPVDGTHLWVHEATNLLLVR
jgi:hypothetical protein